MGFKDNYIDLKNTFNSLVEIDDNELEEIENVSKQDVRKKNTNNLLILTGVATIIWTVAPYLVFKIYGAVDIIVNYLLAKKGHYDKDYIQFTNYSLVIGFSTTLMYLFIVPNIKSFWKFDPQLKVYSNINKRQPNYLLFCVIGCYFVTGVILYVLQLNDLKYSNEIIRFFKYYFSIIFVVISIITLMVMTVWLFLPFIKQADKYDYSKNNRIELAFILLKVLYKLKDYNKVYLIPEQDASEIVKNLQIASNLVRNYPGVLFKQAPSDRLIIQKFNQSANFIDQVNIDFQTTNELKELNLKERLINYLNVILQGNLLDLPKLETGVDHPTPVKKIKPYHYLFLAIYLTLPILIIILLNIFFNVTFSDYNQSLLKILYIIWALVGVLSNPIILNSENKELIWDIIKSWFGKG